MQEFEIIKDYFSKLSYQNQASLKLNDDVFFEKNKKMAISTDTYVEGIHFLNFNRPELVIKKIIRSSISDLICKGVKPKYYFISIHPKIGNDKQLVHFFTLKKNKKNIKSYCVVVIQCFQKN